MRVFKVSICAGALTLLSVAPLVAGTPEASAPIGRVLEPVGRGASADGTTAPPAPAALDRMVKRLQQDAEGHVLTSPTLLEEIDKELTARFGVNGELKLSLVRPWGPVALPEDDYTVTVSEAPSTGLSSSFLVKVKVVSAGEPVGEWTLALRAELVQEVWAATDRLERGQTLDRSQLTLQKIDVLRERQQLIPSDVDPATLELAQPITAPRILTRRDVVERPVVRKGQVVEVVARQGLLAVTMKALALESGATGALIKLRNLESRKEFNGQIIHENQVQVQF